MARLKQMHTEKPQRRIREMIRSIRKEHKIVWLLLSLLLPLLFIASIVFRHPKPVNENIPKIERKN